MDRFLHRNIFGNTPIEDYGLWFELPSERIIEYLKLNTEECSCSSVEKEVYEDFYEFRTKLYPAMISLTTLLPIPPKGNF